LDDFFQRDKILGNPTGIDGEVAALNGCFDGVDFGPVKAWQVDNALFQIAEDHGNGSLRLRGGFGLDRLFGFVGNRFFVQFFQGGAIGRHRVGHAGLGR
jgi:hypothetical protein